MIVISVAHTCPDTHAFVCLYVWRQFSPAPASFWQESHTFPPVCDWVYTEALMQCDNNMFVFLLCSGEGLQPEDTVCLCARAGHKSALKLVNKSHPVFFFICHYRSCTWKCHKEGVSLASQTKGHIIFKNSSISLTGKIIRTERCFLLFTVTFVKIKQICHKRTCDSFSCFPLCVCLSCYHKFAW